MRMRTRTFDSILELLADRRWHSQSEVAERTHYPSQWIDELSRESLLETDEQGGQVLVRLRGDDSDS
jgi:hypothetical protein